MNSEYIKFIKELAKQTKANPSIVEATLKGYTQLLESNSKKLMA